jgi:CRP/FNR family transcriptional regulator
MSREVDNPSCPACDHITGNLFCELTTEHLGTLDTTKTVRRYRRGQPIFAQGDPADALYCIHSGIAALYKIGYRDEEVVIRLLRAGDVAGYRPMLANEPMAASARAIEATTVCLITKSAVFRMLRDSPDLALRLLSKLATELRVSEEEMVARVSQSAPERVARFLLWLVQGFGKEARRPHDLTAPLRRVEMANVIGIAPETLSRVLRDFERQEIIRLDRRFIRVRDMDQLRSLAGGEHSDLNGYHP